MDSNCRFCEGNLVKAGKSRSGAQRYRCKTCRKYQQLGYENKAHEVNTDSLVAIYTEGCGIRSLSRIFSISPGTVLNRLREAAQEAKSSDDFEPQSSYEVDELQTFIGSKENRIWIAYAIERQSKRVVDFVVGSRSSENLKGLIDKVLATQPKRIYTDFLNIYPSIIPKSVHKPSRFMTNSIERLNLTLRTHLKRLSRKTISFSKSEEMLEVSLRLYFTYKDLRTVK